MTFTCIAEYKPCNTKYEFTFVIDCIEDAISLSSFNEIFMMCLYCGDEAHISEIIW